MKEEKGEERERERDYLSKEDLGAAADNLSTLLFLLGPVGSIWSMVPILALAEWL